MKPLVSLHSVSHQHTRQLLFSQNFPFTQSQSAFPPKPNSDEQQGEVSWAESTSRMWTFRKRSQFSQTMWWIWQQAALTLNWHIFKRSLALSSFHVFMTERFGRSVAGGPRGRAEAEPAASPLQNNTVLNREPANMLHRTGESGQSCGETSHLYNSPAFSGLLCSKPITNVKTCRWTGSAQVRASCTAANPANVSRSRRSDQSDCKWWQRPSESKHGDHTHDSALKGPVTLKAWEQRSPVGPIVQRSDAGRFGPCVNCHRALSGGGLKLPPLRTAHTSGHMFQNKTPLKWAR